MLIAEEAHISNVGCAVTLPEPGGLLNLTKSRNCPSWLRATTLVSVGIFGIRRTNLDGVWVSMFVGSKE